MLETLLDISAPLLKVISKKLGGLFVRQKDLSKDHLTKIASLLSGRLVYLMRYMDANPNPVYPKAYGRVLASFVDVGRTQQPARFEVRAEDGWEKASQYACWYLSMLGLVKIYGGIGDEVTISDIGKKVIRSDYIRNQFNDVFHQPLN